MYINIYVHGFPYKGSEPLLVVNRVVTPLIESWYRQLPIYKALYRSYKF